MASKRFLIFLLFLISLSSQRLHNLSVPPKDSFVPIESTIQTTIELTESKTETYYTFDNQHENSDIVITLKNARQYTTRMYIYESYDKISTDKDGNYINYLEEFDLSEKLYYIKDSKKTKYYIIIKDLEGYKAKDILCIYNEEDIIQLKNNEPFNINMFFQKNKYTFTFSGEKDEIIELNMNINDKTFSETLVILRNDIEIYRGEKNQGIISLNDDKEKGEYKILISSTNDVLYQEIKSSIILIKKQYKVNLIEPEKEINVFYINTNNFNFYINLDDYSVGEENMITFKISHNAHKNKLIEYCYAKNMNFKEFDDDKFMSNMPTHDEESESYFNDLNSMDIISHLYFTRTQPVEADKKSYLLVRCQVNIDEEEYYAPEKISIYLSSKPELLDFSEKKDIKFNTKVNIKDYIPKLYRINIPVNDNDLSYVFYTNLKIQAIYENSMLNADYNNEDTLQIYAISNKEIKKAKDYKIIYLKLFGAEQEINLRIESTKSEIYYTHNNERPYRTITQQHLNCGSSFYFIGSYSYLAYDTYFYLEEIFGTYNIYYRNEVSDKDEDSILTNSNDKYLINGKIGNLSNFIDILELKCHTPGYFNLHLLKSYFTKTLTVYQRQVALLSKGSLYIYPQTNEGQKKINLEISSPLGKEIEIANKITLNFTDRYYQIQYKNTSYVPSYIKLNIKEDNTIISIRLTDSNLYQIVEDTSAKINEEYILFKLPNNEEYKNVNITINRVFNDYMYTLFKGDVNYGVNMELSGYETIPLGDNNKINIVLTNPYIKPNKMQSDKEDSPFYIAFYVKDTEGYQKGITVEYTPVDKYDKQWENSVINTLSVNDNDRYMVKIDDSENIKKLSIIYQSCGNALKEIDLYSYDDILNKFENKNKINLEVFDNYLVPEQLNPVFINEEGNKYGGAQVSLVLKEISKEEIDNYNNDKYRLNQKGTKITWDNLNAKEYTLYVFNEKNENLNYMNNICYLDSIKKNMEEYKLKNESDPTYIGIYTTKDNYYDIKETGKYYITVVSESNEPFKYIFNKIYYDSNVSPDGGDDDDDDDNTLLIVLSVVIPIVIIAIIILAYILYKKRKSDISKEIPEENQKLVRDTVMTNTDD